MSEIKPALKAQEWLGVLAMGVDWSGFKMNRHQIAALALVEQPFGFTREDVAMLRGRVESFAPALTEYPGVFDSDAARWANLANRIEALLPPEN